VGQIDRSHRKLAHRGSYLGRVWVSPSSVRRVLDAEGLRLRPLPRPARSVRQPFPDWVEYRPGMLWIFDTTHFTRAKTAVTVIEDLVSRKWLAEVASAEETSIQVQAAVCEALQAEGLMEQVAARLDGVVDLSVDDPSRPTLLAMSDNGPQMTSGSTREFMALCAIHQRFGRPGTPTDQAWIESLFGHVKAEWPHLTKIRDPATLRRARQRTRAVQLGAPARRLGYVTPTTSTKAAASRSARPAKPDSSRPGCGASPTIAPTRPLTRPSTPSTTRPRSPAMLANRSGICVANSETGQMLGFGVSRVASPCVSLTARRSNRPPSRAKVGISARSAAAPCSATAIPTSSADHPG
jgi:putative transposase